ncbi:Uncharacterized protein APZ42_015290 [Daphnia magna]|uniref:Uncharacterized protein n=1 Tax=Daphnia magna TaxID=35525 RepID=A0A162PBG4_9CRUS|nr:Uncharacterized protein APZ42_015290 [Daphnia magna]
MDVTYCVCVCRVFTVHMSKRLSVGCTVTREAIFGLSLCDDATEDWLPTSIIALCDYC